MSEAIDAFYLTQGRFPESPAAIASSGLLAPGDLHDPWGRPYRYILQNDTGKYYLAGFDAEGKTDTDLFFAHVAQGTGASGEIQYEWQEGNHYHQVTCEKSSPSDEDFSFSET